MQTEQDKVMETPEMLKTRTVASTEDQVTEESREPSVQASPIYLGGKKFNSVDELAKYTSELEAQKAQPQWAAPQAGAQEVERPISELLFENPEKALELHEQRVIQKLKAEEAKKQQEQQLWAKFYSSNKDLAEEKELVEYVLGRNWESLKTLHPDQAMEKLADYSRTTMSRFRKTPEKNSELPSGQAKAGPTSTRTAGPIIEKQAAPVDFVTQLKKIQSKRK